MGVRLGAFGAPKWLNLGARGGARGEKETLAKSLFYLRKTMFFEVRGAPARIQIEPKTCSEKSSENHAFLLRFFAIWDPKMDPKWVRFGPKIEQKNVRKLNAKIYAKVAAKVLQKRAAPARVGEGRVVANMQTCKRANM